MKKIFFAIFLMLLCQMAFAEQSSLELSFTSDNKVFASNVIDDDQSIELVELFVVTSGETKKYILENVTEGQVFNLENQSVPHPPGTITEARPIPLGSVQQKTIYYNFFDSDGSATNSKYFLYLFDSGIRQGQGILTFRQVHPVSSKSISARKTESGKEYFVDIKVEAGSAEQMFYYYSYPQNPLGSSEQTLELAKGTDGVFTGSIGLFKGKIDLASRVRAIKDGFAYDYSFDTQSFYLVSQGFDGICKATFSEKQNPKLASVYAMFSPADYVSSLRVIEDTSAGTPSGKRSFKIIRLNDDDSKIEAVSFVIVDTSGTNTKSFSGVSDQENFLLQAPQNAKVYYNFFDSDGTKTGLSFLQSVERQDYFSQPALSPLDTTVLLEGSTIEVIPENDCRSFKIKVTARASPQASGVYLKYGFSNSGDTSFVQLSGPAGLAAKAQAGKTTAFFEGEEEYSVELGPFDQSSGFSADLFAENAQGQTDSILGLSQWTSLSLESYTDEVCGNQLDDDNDGQRDEGCTILPELFFLSSNIPSQYFAGQPILFNAELKNQGQLETQNGFDVAVILNDVFVALAEVDSLLPGQSKEISFNVPNSEKFFGRNELRLLIDPSNVVQESTKTNNELLTFVEVTRGSFKIETPDKLHEKFVGDTRIMKITDHFGYVVPDAKINIVYPSGVTFDTVSDSRGFAEVFLEERGLYQISVAKQGFSALKSEFLIPKILWESRKGVFNLGEELLLSLQTDEGQFVPSTLAHIETPLGETKTFSPGEKYQLTTPGTYKIAFVRKDYILLHTDFVVLGQLESVFFGSSLQNILFGEELLNDLPLFLSVLLLCLISMWVFYTRSHSFFPQGQSSSQKLFISLVKVFVFFVLLLLPFQAARLFGFYTGIAFSLFLTAIILLLDFLAKKKKEPKPIRL